MHIGFTCRTTVQWGVVLSGSMAECASSHTSSHPKSHWHYPVVFVVGSNLMLIVYILEIYKTTSIRTHRACGRVEHAAGSESYQAGPLCLVTAREGTSDNWYFPFAVTRQGQ